MCDERPADDHDAPALSAPEPGPGPGPIPGLVEEIDGVAVALIAPAAAYEAIDTGTGSMPTGIGPEIFVTREEPPAEPPPSHPSAPVLDAIGRLHADLGTRIDRLQSQIERELRAESSRERVVDRLHAELQDYKNDLLLKITRPIFVDLIQLHDDLGKMAESVDDPRSVGIVRDAQQGIEDVLYRQGVEPFVVDGDTFDPRRQRAVSTVATDDPTQNKAIAARLRSGFAAGDKVIRPELVSVFAQRRAPAVGGSDVPAGS